jgi:hypothetical protein
MTISEHVSGHHQRHLHRGEGGDPVCEERLRDQRLLQTRRQQRHGQSRKQELGGNFIKLLHS